MEKNTRFQFELPTAKADEINDLMEECGIKTKAEFLNNAIAVLKWAINASKRGDTIASVDEEHGKFRELQMPILDAVRPTARATERRERERVA